MDDEKYKGMKLPLDFIKRSTEIFWIFGLPITKHEIDIKWMNPCDGVDIILENTITYSDQPLKNERKVTKNF